MNPSKSLLALALTAGLLAGLAGCGSKGTEGSQDTSGQPSQGGESTSQSASQPSGKAVTLSAAPVAAGADTFILQDPATDYYGLVDSSGKEILPCQYGDMFYLTVNKLDPKTYVAVQEKGSYGVYDLTGTQVLAPAYDSIEGASFSDAFVVGYHDSFGVVDLTGQELVPMDYLGISCSAQGMFAGTKESDGGCTVDLYQKDGTLSDSWSAHSSSDPYAFYGYGTELHGAKCYTLSGEEISLIGNLLAPNSVSDNSSSLVAPYFCYTDGSQLLVTDASSGKTVFSQPLKVELGTPFLLEFNVTRDLGNGTLHATASVGYYQGEKVSGEQLFRLTLGDTVQCFDQGGQSLALDGIGGSTKQFGMGPYYNGTAFAVTEDERIVVVDESGAVVRELTLPFSDLSRCYFLGSCAVLYNNGYVYVADQEGNTIANQDGYTGVKDKGLLFLVTAEGPVECPAADGSLILSAEQGLTDPEVKYSSDWEDGTFHSAILSGTNLLVDRENALLLAEMDETLTAALLDETATLLASQDDSQLYAVQETEGQWQVQLLAQR